jgi:hypothetical protein
VVERSTVLVAVAASVSLGCGARGLASTTIVSPAHAQPGQMGYGTGVNLSVGSTATSSVADAVVVAAASDPHGPSEKAEGDTVWHVRGGVLEACERADDARFDCRLASYEGYTPPPLFTFLPTIIEPGNLGGGAKAVVGDVSVGLVAGEATKATRFEPDRSIWVTASAKALVGADPVFLCSIQKDTPVCHALPFSVQRVLGVAVVKSGPTRHSVLWVHAALNVGLTRVDLGLHRCESKEGIPVCAKAQEVLP